MQTKTVFVTITGRMIVEDNETDASMGVDTLVEAVSNAEMDLISRLHDTDLQKIAVTIDYEGKPNPHTHRMSDIDITGGPLGHTLISR